jgi:hypothetical protein
MNIIDDVERVAIPHACVGALGLLLAEAIKGRVPAAKREVVFRQMVELMADDFGFAVN